MSDKPRGRAYSKRQRNWRRGEDSSRDKEALSPRPFSQSPRRKTQLPVGIIIIITIIPSSLHSFKPMRPA
ncbi:Hypothetical protein FKW44_001846 [Caligus rogercresseyi]|uniref:Uncharacterized protein n=1 Tax=Caligus rogercresseyi TaxID=217165 RepID=A0A7T8KJB8_CALRO|nr:Hypothetical protein FKW44_001846 [Caligus rogercresseyi]